MTPDPSFVISVAVAATVIAGVSILSGALLLWSSIHAPEPAARSRFEWAIGLASLAACASGLLTGLLEAIALAYAEVMHSRQLHLNHAVLITSWVVVGWTVGFFSSIQAAYREARVGSTTRPPIKRNALFYGVVLIVWALLVRGPITTDEAIGLVGAIPVGGIAFTSRLRWWIEHTVYQHQKASALALIIFGVLLAASFTWFGFVALR